MGEMIYFDNAATTYPKPERVYRAVDEANRNLAVNAGRGSYRLAKKASGVIEETRKNILMIAGAKEVAEVVFTASATLACNQIIGGMNWKKEDTVYVTPYEHNAVMRVLSLQQQQYGFRIEELAVEPDTLCMDLEKIKYRFSRVPPTAVIMSHVSNVTGYIIPWQEIAKEAKKYEAVIVVDGSQALGLVPVNLKNTDADFYIFAGHKTLYGTFGVGGYINQNGKKLKPLLAGGTGSDSLNLSMPQDTVAGFEPGSPNIVAIAGLLAATEDILSGQIAENPLEKEQRLRRYLAEKLQKIPGVILYPKQSMKQNLKKHTDNASEAEMTGITAFNIEGLKAADMGMILDEDYNIAVRTGYHCAPLIHKYLQDEAYSGVVRVSVGRFNTEEEIDCLIQAVEEITMG